MRAFFTRGKRLPVPLGNVFFTVEQRVVKIKCDQLVSHKKSVLPFFLKITLPLYNNRMGLESAKSCGGRVETLERNFLHKLERGECGILKNK